MASGAARRQPFGWPLRCPKCSGPEYYGRLKVPGDAAGNKLSLKCPNCGTRLTAATQHKADLKGVAMERFVQETSDQ